MHDAIRFMAEPGAVIDLSVVRLDFLGIVEGSQGLSVVYTEIAASPLDIVDNLFL